MKHLLLLHGALGHSANFLSLLPFLEKNFIIHTLTFYGHGGKEFPSESLKMDHYVEQIKNYCEEKSLDKVSIFGYSMGGYAAILYASQYPNVVEKVITLATKIAWSPETAQKEVKMLHAETILEKVPKFAEHLSSLHGIDSWKKLTKEVAHLLLDLGENPRIHSDLLKNMTTPMQFMVGDKDKMVSIQETYEAYLSSTNANFSVLPNTIHPLEKVDADVLTLHLKKFLL